LGGGVRFRELGGETGQSPCKMETKTLQSHGRVDRLAKEGVSKGQEKRPSELVSNSRKGKLPASCSGKRGER